jgi:flagellar L-ring protein precursor FlgH
MKIAALLVFVMGLGACSLRMPEKPEASFNEKLLASQEARLQAGEDVYGDRNPEPTSDPLHSSLWAKSVGSPYIIRNQKASKVGDLITIVIREDSKASSSANTETNRDSSIDAAFDLKMGTDALGQKGLLDGNAGLKNDFKGEGKTDRSGRIEATVQAVVETVLPNGTLFIRGRKVITVNNEDQVVELSGFVRPDDIRINNTVASDLLADAKIKYLGHGVVGDKQYVGWGARLMDWVWPF